LFVGMSGGGMIYTALEVAKVLGAGRRVVTIACDTGARYLSTALFAESTEVETSGHVI
jgi:cysteine synthase